MTTSQTVWGVHMGVHVGNRPIEEGYVAIGWPDIGDPRRIPASRDAFKEVLSATYGVENPGALPVYAGMLFRFVHEMRAGDVVVYPSKSDRMVNVGRFTGDIDHVSDDPDGYPNRRKVEWLASRPRSDFTQSALHEIGSALTLFRVKRHAQEFLDCIGVPAGRGQPAPATEDEDEAPDDLTALASVSQQAEMSTSDFVIRRILEGLSGPQFEYLVAHLMECMGYTARVTQQSGDGGVDVIAHRDALGFEPPIVKIQCKRTAGQTGEPDVNQLLGTLGDGEYGLFVNLGSYTRAARLLERNRAKLRLIDGEEFADMLLSNYARLSPRYRSIIPLKQIYVPEIAIPSN